LTPLTQSSHPGEGGVDGGGVQVVAAEQRDPELRVVLDVQVVHRPQVPHHVQVPGRLILFLKKIKRFAGR
jgi:hypothetical protein